MKIINLKNNRWIFYIDRIVDSDRKNAEILGIDYNKFRKIVQQYGAIIDCSDDDCYFKSYEDALRCLNSPELEPYIMMLKLTGDV